jgi:hypothetical protein
MRGTGVYATDDQIEQMKAAMNMPAIMVGGVTPRTPQQVCHAIALENGLPEIEGYYGCDLSTKEFLTS